MHRNRYSKGMDDEQKTPRGHPDFHSYVKIQRVFIDNGQTDKKTNVRTDREIHLLRGTIFPVVLLCQFLVLSGNRFWFYKSYYLCYT